LLAKHRLENQMVGGRGLRKLSQGLAERLRFGSVLKGHDFSRAEKARENDGLQPLRDFVFR